jgi:hypothetical protein
LFDIGYSILTQIKKGTYPCHPLFNFFPVLG